MKIEIKNPTSNELIKNPNIAIQGIIRIPHDEFKTVQHYLQYHLKGNGEDITKAIALPSVEQFTKSETEYVKTFRIPVKLTSHTEILRVEIYRSGEDAPLASDKITLNRKYVNKKPDVKKGNHHETGNENRATGDNHDA